MYTLYIGNKNYSSWSLRPWILMRERAIPFEERLRPFEPGGSFASFRAFSPSGKVPCLHDGDAVVWDSLAIAEYLAERHAGVWPADGRARAWARSAAAEMHSGFAELRRCCTMNVGIRLRLGAIGDELQRDIDRLGELWNEGLSRHGGPFLAGREFTAVDAFFAPVAFRHQTYGFALGAAAADYAARLLALPGMQQWQREALAEPWRELDHEEDARLRGTWIADLRSPARADAGREAAAASS